MLLRHIATGLLITLLSIGTVAAYRGSHSTISTTTAAATNPNDPSANSSLISDRSDTTIALSPTKTKGLQTAVFAGGCFWGVEAVFEHVKGVSKVISGYSGGSKDTANYGAVSTGQTGHAEAVQITYDPQQISYEQLLNIFFTVTHDPTELNRQGPDAGTQY